MAPVKSLLRKLRKINQSRNQIRAEPILAREARDESPTSGLAMGLFSAGFPTGVRGTCLASPNEPASLLPFGLATQSQLGRSKKLHCS